MPVKLALRAYLAECLAVFTLTLAVSLSIAQQFPFTPLLAALVVGMFVYTIGAISGAHINPAVTVGLWSVQKIKAKDAVFYLVFQVIGALLALLASWGMTGAAPTIMTDNAMGAGLGEMIGAFLLVFGVSAVAFGSVKEDASGLTVGGSLLMGIAVAGSMSNGVLNPAVALGIGAVSAMYVVAPLVGGIVAAQVYRYLKG